MADQPIQEDDREEDSIVHALLLYYPCNPFVPDSCCSTPNRIAAFVSRDPILVACRMMQRRTAWFSLGARHVVLLPNHPPLDHGGRSTSHHVCVRHASLSPKSEWIGLPTSNYVARNTFMLC